MALAMDLTKVKFILLYMSTEIEGLGEDKLMARWDVNLEVEAALDDLHDSHRSCIKNHTKKITTATTHYICNIAIWYCAPMPFLGLEYKCHRETIPCIDCRQS